MTGFTSRPPAGNLSIFQGRMATPFNRAPGTQPRPVITTTLTAVAAPTTVNGYIAVALLRPPTTAEKKTRIINWLGSDDERKAASPMGKSPFSDPDHPQWADYPHLHRLSQQDRSHWMDTVLNAHPNRAESLEVSARCFTPRALRKGKLALPQNAWKVAFDEIDEKIERVEEDLATEMLSRDEVYELEARMRELKRMRAECIGWAEVEDEEEG